MTVILRHPTGFEGEIGELLYDGQELTFLTPPEVHNERARRLADHACVVDSNPEGARPVDRHR